MRLQLAHIFFLAGGMGVLFEYETYQFLPTLYFNAKLRGHTFRPDMPDHTNSP